MTEAPTGVGRAPGLPRFTFLWAFLAGIILITLIRPCLRRVPEPPPVQGDFPAAVNLAGTGGGVIRGVSLRGSVWVMSFEAEACDAACAERRARMKELADAFTGFHLGGIRLLNIDVGPDAVEDPRPPLWIAAHLDEPDLAQFGGASRLGHLLIVDPSGGLRGWYAGDKDGFNEVYNRAQHVRSATQPSERRSGRE
jgi:hypothetical protein